VNIVGFSEFSVSQVRLIGVYILFLGDEVMYVGQSTHVAQRLLLHQAQAGRRRHRWRFDRVLWAPLAKRDLSAYEGALARALNPKHTIRVNRDSSRDAEILASLDLGRDPTRTFEIRAAEHEVATRHRTKRWQRARDRRLAAYDMQIENEHPIEAP
jgi:predicted GIY-YIG superfamily endonuclease